MMNNNFDPYDLLMETADRLSRLEQAHNKLAHAYQKTDQELTVALHSLKNLQQHHLRLKQKFEQRYTDSLHDNTNTNS